MAHQGKGGGSGVSRMQTIRGCIVRTGFKNSNKLSKNLPFIKITINRQLSEISVKKYPSQLGWTSSITPFPWYTKDIESTQFSFLFTHLDIYREL